MTKRNQNSLVRILVVLLAAATVATAQVPQMIHYQGRATFSGTPYSGTGYFKFALVDAAGAFYWYSDALSPAGVPTAPVTLNVRNGVYSAMLGNTALPGMTYTIPPTVFNNTVVFLRVWFGPDPGSITLVTPDIRIASVGYAMIAETVVDGMITEQKLGDGAVTVRKLANDAITSAKLAEGAVSSRELRDKSVTSVDLDDDIKLGDRNVPGRLEVYPGGSAIPVITLDGNDADSKGRITTQVLEITGGSDLSENFDITSEDDSPKPGMIVCIDPSRPGQLTVSSRAYDRTVAGIMSGAGGVQPGMLMGQRGTAANGKHAVALTGRVYCQADASNGAIEPGDLLTTSGLPGHAMKVTEQGRAQGAIIGKAMSSLSEGTGLVLVLVSLQ